MTEWSWPLLLLGWVIVVAELLRAALFAGVAVMGRGLRYGDERGPLQAEVRRDVLRFRRWAAGEALYHCVVAVIYAVPLALFSPPAPEWWQVGGRVAFVVATVVAGGLSFWALWRALSHLHIYASIDRGLERRE